MIGLGLASATLSIRAWTRGPLADDVLVHGLGTNRFAQTRVHVD